MEDFDVFLSYHWRDHAAVEALAQRLRGAGLHVFLDRWYLTPGTSWVRTLEDTLARCRAVAICTGSEMGSWQQREAGVALDRQVREKRNGKVFPVIPVLLPGAEAPLGFLRQNTWVDLRERADDAQRLAILAKAIRGEPPGPELQEAIARSMALVCPYRGLNYFREEDAAFFFGREAATAQLVEAVGHHRLVAVVGASGSGKSSVVRAGLVPALRARREDAWEIVTLVPNDRPLYNLSAALLPLLEPGVSEVDRLGETKKLADRIQAGEIQLRDVVQRVLELQPGTQRLLLVVDQWEELFTLTENAEQRQCFIDNLLEATQTSALNVVLTLRGDYVGRALTSQSNVTDRLQGDQVILLGPMTEEKLRRAIEEPARQVGLEFEPHLVELILDHAVGEPGHLPLLEFVLRELWEQRQGRVMHRAAYDAMGQLEGAIAKRAEALYDELTRSDPQAAQRIRSIVLRLVRPGEGELDTRRRALLEDFDAPTQKLVEQLGKARLLVSSADVGSQSPTVEVAHEALIAQWKRLRDWVGADRQFMAWRQRLDDEVTEWEKQQHKAGLLLQGLRLAEARDWLKRRREDLSERECAYIKVSAMRRKVRIRSFAGAAIAAVVAIAAFGIDANNERQRARAGEIATTAESLAKSFPDQSLLLALEARRTSPVPKANGLLRAASATYPYRAALRGHEGRVYIAQFSADGKTVLTASNDKTARLWDVASGKELHVLRGHEDAVGRAQFSADGKTVLTASEDKTARLWEVASGKELYVLRGHGKMVTSAQFSADGKTVLTASEDKTARLWEVASGKELRALRGHAEMVTSAQFSADGKTVLTTSFDKTARLWDVTSGNALNTLRGHEHVVFSAQFSADGKTVLTASEDKTVRLWEVASGKELRALRGHEGGVYIAQFSADGKTVLTASSDKTARLWEVASGKELRALRGHEDVVISAQFSADGKTVLTASWDKTARLWDVASGKELRALRGHEGEVTSAQFSADGKTVLTASWDKTARLWDVASGNALNTLRGHEREVFSAQFSADGKAMLTASADSARLWDVASGKELHVFRGHGRSITRAQFSPDGKAVLTASRDKTARLWDVESGQELRALRGHEDEVISAQFSADGKKVLTASKDKTARLWEVASGKELRAMRGHGSWVSSAQFSADGKTVLTASWDHTAQLWDMVSGKELRVLRGHEDTVTSAQFSADGKTVLTVSWDKTARLWDVATGKELRAMRGHQIEHAEFSADGKTVLTASQDETARLWDVVSGQELRVLHGHGRSITSAQFSADGKTVVTACDDHTARLWDVSSGQELRVFRGHEGGVTSAQFSADGKKVVTASFDKTARVWDCPECRSAEEVAPEVARKVGRELTEAERRRFGLPTTAGAARNLT
ncbi:TIR domain-containing protein [Variovorax sp. J22R115]|uniref:nSTAND1 domain-containing NTPase n=1 Tax=Variovorax sp. J22R115 TaxID=3053509 RepID=UPI002575F215|nr:TIR domain-containing protein [Variovorax sp. J22R115]MDM0053663.1 TIR domain-containing protein [Variovorax sp. J22R115]